MSALEEVRAELAALADRDRAAAVARYLEVVPGGYGEGDQLLGIPVPAQRGLARRYWRRLTLDDVATLLGSGVHEERLTAVFVLVRQFRASPVDGQRRIVDLVLASTARLDNWDLVDSSAPYLLGPWLLTRDRSVLDRLAASDLVWDRRIAVMATYALVRAGEFGPTLRLARRLLDDPHDVVHKAVGWMLREVGHRDRAVEEAFLDEHAAVMPRVMLRYALEKFPPERRSHYRQLARRR